MIKTKGPMPAIVADTHTFLSPAKRRGRPARLSADTVIEAALQLLDTCAAEDFTMTRVAQALGTTTMALYRYFPSREALLEALAEHVFGQFQMQACPDATWQETLFAWQRALKAHFERHQALTRLMAWNGHLSGAWLKVIMPVIETLYGVGFRGRRLVDTVTWFLTETTGLLFIWTADLLLSFDGRGRTGPGYQALNFVDGMKSLDGRQRQIMEEMVPYANEVDAEAMIEFGFRHLINGIESLMKGATFERKSGG
jgi:AcrR family transcriptional regulator